MITVKKFIGVVALSFCLMNTANINAQVTIGADEFPHSSSILDLSKVESHDLGLLLPRVAIADVKVFQLQESGSDTYSTANGLIVYNTNENVTDGRGSGIYVWYENLWRPLNEFGAKTTFNKLKGKKLTVYGNSITTYSGTQPAGYAVYYPSGDVNSPDKTWWGALIKETGMILEKNNSWSGSRVSLDNTTSSMSSDNRLRNMGKPDIILMLGGTNDWAGNVPLGGINYENPDKSTITGGFIYSIQQMKLLYPDAEIFICSPLQRSGSKPLVNNGLYFYQIRDRIEELTKALCVHFIDLYDVNINPETASNTSFTIDGLHPNAAGMLRIKERLKQELYLKAGFSESVEYSYPAEVSSAEFFPVGSYYLTPLSGDPKDLLGMSASTWVLEPINIRGGRLWKRTN
jgi:lysophospholipase L1-like esterase